MRINANLACFDWHDTAVNDAATLPYRASKDGCDARELEAAYALVGQVACRGSGTTSDHTRKFRTIPGFWNNVAVGVG